ncbi:MAG: PmoA family protein [Prolixibacteraceae bacterium]|jgi:type 1 glutamine amidotransferase|nr:PmoA family protein [Prolixibacteraceae bacterium]
MNRIHFIFFFLVMVVSSGRSYAAPGQHQKEPIRVLILSGSNNHEWKKTTPLLNRIFDEANLFSTRVTDKPDTLTYVDLKKFDLVVSNANTWPDNNRRLSRSWEADFLKYVSEGGGTLFFHAGASSFYGWDEYRKMGIGRWGKETFHNAPIVASLYGLDQKHPITKGLKGFQIMDEIWEKTELFAGAKAIGSLKATNAKDGHPIDEPAIWVNQTGKGRSFFTILGHDERALLNSGLRTLLVRAAQWCAGKTVTFKPPVEMSMIQNPGKPQYSWLESDTTFTLLNHKEIVWQFNYRDRFQRPYFHPLTVNNTLITCVSPPDHPWHLGMWFCWKYINHLNYWEYLNENRSAKTGYKSEGSTEIMNSKIVKNPDFTCDIRLNINYHPLKGETVMTEERSYHVSAPDKDGNYFIDEDHLFKILADSVVLDRTPPTIRGGRIQGGYAGISIRFNQDFTAPVFKSSGDMAQCKKCDWQYYGFTSMTGKKVGIKIEQDPKFRSSTSSWYIINDPLIPFYYFSPAVIFDSPVVLKKGANWRLKYRIQMIEGELK